MEGVCIKIEERVLERLKWVRASFLSALVDSGSHWVDRPIVNNSIAEGTRLAPMAPLGQRAR